MQSFPTSELLTVLVRNDRGGGSGRVEIKFAVNGVNQQFYTGHRWINKKVIGQKY